MAPAYGGEPLATEPANSAVTTSASMSPRDPSPVRGLRVLARGATRAIVTDASRVYFGDAAEDAVVAVRKSGGTPVVVGRPAPLQLALTPSSIVWIGGSGAEVLRAPRGGGVAKVIRDRGRFTALAARDEDVYVAEALPEGGAVTRLTGPTASRLASLPQVPSAIAADEDCAYALTKGAVFSVPRNRGESKTIAELAELDYIQLQRDEVYATAVVDGARAVIVVPKSGGDRIVLARGVRDAPIATYGRDIYYFDEREPEIRRVSMTGGSPVVVARDHTLRSVAALAVDDSGVYVGTPVDGVLALPRPD